MSSFDWPSGWPHLRVVPSGAYALSGGFAALEGERRTAGACARQADAGAERGVGEGREKLAALDPLLRSALGLPLLKVEYQGFCRGFQSCRLVCFAVGVQPKEQLCVIDPLGNVPIPGFGELIEGRYIT